MARAPKAHSKRVNPFRILSVRCGPGPVLWGFSALDCYCGGGFDYSGPRLSYALRSGRERQISDENLSR